MVAFVVVLALSAGTGADSIVTRDGQLHEGKILSETATGYLFRDESTGETSVIEFSTITDLRKGSETAGVAAPPSPPGDRTARIAQLTVEIHDLKLELDEATIWPAFVKFGLAATAGAAATLLFVLWGENPDSKSWDGNYTAGAACIVAGASLAVWGGLQLLIRLLARDRLPNEIADREEQLRRLGAGQSMHSSSPAFFFSAASVPHSEHELRGP